MNFLSYSKKKNLADNRTAIDSLRLEREWDAALELTKKTQAEDTILLNLLNGEVAFDNERFDEAKEWWTKVIEGSSDSYEINEARALLGKLEFIEKRKKEALNFLKNLPDLFREEAIAKTGENIHSSYRLFLYLEGIKLKGLCEFENGDLENSIKTFRIVIDIGYNLCVQKQYISKQDQPLREIIEDSLYSIPKLYFQLRDIKNTIESLREAINPKYTPSASQKRRISKDLAKVLLYHTQTIDSLYPPLKEKQQPYNPSSAFEEGVYMALKYENELISAQNSKSVIVYNDIIFGCGLHKDYTTIIESIERAILPRSEDPHLWSELALSLLSAKRYSQALVVIKEYLEVTPKNAVMLLFAAKVCLNHLNLYSDAILYCRRSIALCKENANRLLLARSWHLLGVAYGMAAKSILSVEQHKLYKKAIDALVKALNLGLKDYLFLFHLSLQYAEIREIAKALHYIQQSTTLNPSYAPSWVLYVLLLTSLKKNRDASSLCKLALRHHPENLQLLYINVKLSLELEETSEAFSSLQQLCKTVKLEKSYGDNFEERATSYGNTFSADDGQDSMVSGSAVLQSDSNSTTVLESVKQDELSVSRIWIMIAEIFISMKKFNDAENSIGEAKRLNPKSAEIYFLKGTMLDSDQHTLEAKEQYSTAISINSNHLLANIRLAEYYSYHGQIEVAETILGPLVRKYPSSSRAWFAMGNLLQKKGDNASASDCFIIALELGDTDPIVPFSFVTHKIP